MSENLKFTNNGYDGTFWLPTGAYMSGGLSLAISAGFSVGTLAYNGSAKHAFLDVSYLYGNEFWANGSVKSAHASECILYFCVQGYSPKVVAGTYAEQWLSSWPNPDTPFQQARYGSTLNTPSDTDIKLRPPSGAEEYTVDSSTFSQLKSWLGEMFHGMTLGTKFDDNYYGDTFDLAQAIHDIQTETGDPSRSGAERVMDTFALGFSAVIRRQANSSTAVSGTAFREQSYVSARWRWAILPIALVALTCSFMITTLAVTARDGMPVWKSSALATLAHGLGESSSGIITANRLDVIESKAHGHKMAMRDQQRQWRLESVAV